MSADLKDIVRRCLDNDRLAQKWLFDRYAGLMMGICMRYMGNREQAEDVLQNGFVKIFRYMEKYRNEGSFEGWMKRIMINQALETLRKKDLLNQALRLEDHTWQVSDDMPDGQSTLQHKELLEMITRLPAGFRTVFNMYAIEGYTHPEIAEQLNISVGTSKSQYARARAQIRTMIEKQKIAI